MCPACIASAAAMAASATSTTGFLAVILHKFRKLFSTKSLALFTKAKEK